MSDTAAEIIRYTYADYVSWDTDTRYELIDGVPYAMSAPSFAHQSILLELGLQFGNFLKGKPCQLLLAPFDVRLNAHSWDDTVVQPDLLVVCDREKLKDGKTCVGAPDLALEILSPSSRRMDLLTKHKKYLEAGVREYWVIDPEAQAAQVYLLDNGRYTANVYDHTDTVAVQVLAGCEIQLHDVFTAGEM